MSFIEIFGFRWFMIRNKIFLKVFKECYMCMNDLRFFYIGC